MEVLHNSYLTQSTENQSIDQIRRPRTYDSNLVKGHRDLTKHVVNHSKYSCSNSDKFTQISNSIRLWGFVTDMDVEYSLTGVGKQPYGRL